MTHMGEQLRTEIEERFGFFPPFFEPALDSPQVLENLWRQTVSAYVDNPLSALFKEKLNALLSRYCVAPYCMIVHSAALRPLGMTAREVLTLLETPPPDDLQDSLPLGVLPVPTPEEAAAPTPNSLLEKTLLFCAAAFFLEQTNAGECRAEMRRLLGTDLYSSLVAYLAYIKTCHVWIEAHPSISSEADQRAIENLGPLLAEEPALAEFFRHYPERVAHAQASRKTQTAVAAERTRADQAIRDSEEKLRLLVDGAKDYAMILLDREGRVTGWNTGAERILGWTEAEALNQPADLIFTPEDRAANIASQELNRAAAQGKAMDMRWHRRKDGSCFFADGIMEALRDENGNLRGFAKILRDATERKSMEEEQNRLADANRLLLDSTGEGIYGIDSQGRFTFVNRAAAQMLGFSQEEMLGCSGHALIHHSRPDGTPYPEVDCPIYQAMRGGRSMRVEEDALWRKDGTPFPIAYSASPILEEGVVRGAVITFSDISERQALQQAQAALFERERNIASQLQQALQPELPGTVPGLAVTRYCEAALAEAGVGGDFYDVFAVEKGCTALVVGDLSGKGLAAAAQVATVRNMLRAFLYTRPTVADAVIDLNRVLAENGLLTGFSTLFVGAYDGGTRALNYVNCGQEPALIRRGATRAIEPLLPTGPILGTLPNAQYNEATVTLARGDALAIFSDGLTEVGPTRREMLGIEGVTALFGETVAPEAAESAAEMAESLALQLISGVDTAAAGGVMRDDVCLLVAVAE